MFVARGPGLFSQQEVIIVLLAFYLGVCVCLAPGTRNYGSSMYTLAAAGGGGVRDDPLLSFPHERRRQIDSERQESSHGIRFSCFQKRAD